MMPELQPVRALQTECAAPTCLRNSNRIAVGSFKEAAQDDQMAMAVARVHSPALGSCGSLRSAMAELARSR